jgi:hypothetical protein
MLIKDKKYIFNIALGIAGCPLVTGTEDNSTEGRACNLFYDIAYQELINDGRYGDLTQINIPLVKVPTERFDNGFVYNNDGFGRVYKYIYDYPTDCITLYDVLVPMKNTGNYQRLKHNDDYLVRYFPNLKKSAIAFHRDYEQEGFPLLAEYSCQVDNFTYVNAGLITALTHRLAYYLCLNLRKDANQAAQLLKIAESLAKSAKLNSLNESNIEDPKFIPDSIAVRFGGTKFITDRRIN